jgi:DeoR family fructose operon transcriptional repressor
MTIIIPVERRNRIYKTIQANGTVSVASLSKLLSVSEMTIRRDLEQMEMEGLLERTHGGAIISQRIHLEPLYSEKHRAHPAEKRAIGQTAASFVHDNETVLINSGSTTLQLFHHLAGKTNVKVITSNMNAFLEAQGSGIELILTGGTYRPQSNSMVGPLAMLSLAQVNASKCFIGVDGVSLKYGVTTPNMQEAEVARMMIERTRGEVIVLADHSKFGVVADFLTAPLEKIDILITDAGMHPEAVENLQAAGIRVLTA